MTTLAPKPPALWGELSHGARRLGIDTGQEPVVYLRRDSSIVRSKGCDSQTRGEGRSGGLPPRDARGRSSGGTVRAASRLLAHAGFTLRWVVAVHAVADPLSAAALEREARVELVTCNTIPHPSNRIDVLDAICAAVERRIPAGVMAEAATAAR
jgi:hypothetical protein